MADEDLKNPHVRALRDLALSYPETHEAFPWGHRVIKVKAKAFVFVGGEPGTFSLSVKLPHSNEAALSLPFTEPTGYGLGKSGWVSARFGAREELPVPILRAWIDESFRAVAPKTLVARLDGAPARATGKASAPAQPASKGQENALGAGKRVAAKAAAAPRSKRPPVAVKPAPASTTKR